MKPYKHVSNRSLIKSVSNLIYLILILCSNSNADPVIDRNVFTHYQQHQSNLKKQIISLMLFFNHFEDRNIFLNSNKNKPSIHFTSLDFMPVIIVTFKDNFDFFSKLLQNKQLKYIALNEPAGEKVEVNTNHVLIRPKTMFHHPGLNLWWNKGYDGHSATVAIIDSGIASEHPALRDKTITISPLSYFENKRGVRSAHGTGVACIYSGDPKNSKYRGIAYKTPRLLSTIAGEGNKTLKDFYITYSGLNWIFTQKNKPWVINYSFGNGPIACKTCPDWSGMARVVDYIVNQKNILWVTSAGNNGYVKPRHHYPFTSTMTVPADSYNSLTVANMNMYKENNSIRKLSRLTHAIKYTSSRGPTRSGRKKPDITAPGNDTYTCAPDPQKYRLNYKSDMNYSNGYRLMGGTSSAAPYVGAAIILLKESGIRSSKALKALLINSADTWTDNQKPGPDDPTVSEQGTHQPLLGSEWNPTYGWGYINMEKAFYQRKHIINGNLSLLKPEMTIKLKLLGTDKVTLVHERRVGFNIKGKPWRLTALKLQALDPITRKILVEDSSIIDNVHQISLCTNSQSALCFVKQSRTVLIRIVLASDYIDGSIKEPFSLVYS